ncbi:hypothetical protein AB3S75_035816 [Citrus x aurantiifolia]
MTSHLRIVPHKQS